MTLTRKEVQAFFERSGGHPSRALGQNFVVDANTVRKIARLADVTSETHVVEIGAGLGSLTLALAETGARVTAIEIDKYLIDELRHNTRDLANVTVVHTDAMAIDWQELLPAEGGPYVLVANLPYNVATPLVADLLDFVPQIHRMLVMVQKEVGERLAAKVGDDAYGAVSVKIAYWTEASLAGLVPPSVFLPQPNVDSALVRLDRRVEPAVSGIDPEDLFYLVRAGFSQRRKMLRRVLSELVTAEMFDEAAVDPQARAEALDVADWGRLAKVWVAKRTSVPPSPSVTGGKGKSR